MAPWIIRLDQKDRLLLHLVLTHRHRSLDPFMRVLTHLGGATFTVLMTAILLAGVIPGLQAAAAEAAVALLGSHLAVQLFKRATTRERPSLPAGTKALAHAPDRFSFPSGHAAAALSVAAPIGIAVGWPGGVALLLLTGIVGVSRCYLGVHYPGDVLAGWLLAAGGVVGAVPVLDLLGSRLSL